VRPSIEELEAQCPRKLIALAIRSAHRALLTAGHRQGEIE
jgi:hypothetical protein